MWAPQRITVLVAIAASLAAGALAGLTWTVGVHRVLVRLVHPHWLWIGVAAIGELAAYAGYVVAYRVVAAAEGGADLGVGKTTAIVVSGFGAFVHGGGFMLDREALRRAGLTEGEARRRVLGLGMLEYSILAPATLVAAAYLLVRTSSISVSLTLPWIIGVPVGAALALLGLRFRERVRRWPLVGRRLGHTLDALDLVLRLFRCPRRSWVAFAGLIVYWGGEVFCLWSTLQAFSAHQPPPAQLLVGYATGYALTRRALPLGGAGVVEALLPLALGWLDIQLAPALLAVFVYRIFNLWLPLVPALASLPSLRRLQREQRGGRRARRRAARAARQT